jgi:D-alanine-D-alanine ligase
MAQSANKKVVMTKLNVALLFGGPSSEHEISCATAAGVMGAIDRDKYNLIAIGITKAGDWILGEDDAAKWALRKGNLATVEPNGTAVKFATDGSRELFATDATGARSSLGVIDVVFPVLHGPYGEDGTLQRELEGFGVPYVGNGVLASERGMDKELSKDAFLAAGVPATPHVVIQLEDWQSDPESALEKVRALGNLPLFVKPARAGSSKGVSKVKAMDDFAAAVATAFKEDDKLVVECGIEGREVEVAVLEGHGGSAPRVSVAGEIIVSGRDFYDFDAKYQDEDAVQLVIPAELSDSELQDMQALAARAFNALGCEGLARADFFLTKKGFLINEINTMPGFTPLSMFPSLWQASGISYPDLIDELIELALQKKNS